MPSDYARTLPLGDASARALVRLHLDPWLLLGLGAIVAFGLLVLYSASHRDLETLANQALRIGVAFAAMFVVAQLNPRIYLRWAPGLYILGIVLLIAVLLFGTTVKGSQRWLDLPGLPSFQPSELMKLAVPLAIAWYFHARPLPPRIRHVLGSTGAVRLADRPDRSATGPGYGVDGRCRRGLRSSSCRESGGASWVL